VNDKKPPMGIIERLTTSEDESEQTDLGTQVERIIRSEEFRNSETLRKLLLYLADKAIAGEADTLKEYVVAIEALGKPPTYDPQHNSTVRIQVGRLRQKLAEYYRNDGKQDDLIVDLPRGRFRLICKRRSEDGATLPAPPPQVAVMPLPPEAPSSAYSRHRTMLLGMALGVLLSLAGYSAYSVFKLLHMRHTQTVVMNAELEELWSPLLDSNRPLIFCIEDPLFVEINTKPGIYYRDRSINHWNEAEDSAIIRALSQSVGKQQSQPSRYYTALGEAEAAFLIGNLMGSRGRAVSMLRASQLSWQQLADNNIIFVGVQNLFFEQLQGMPVATELIVGPDGVHNTHPAAGEPPIFLNAYTTAPTEQGLMYALVTYVTGPNGRGAVMSFSSERSAGYLGAVQFFANPESARLLIAKLREKNGGALPHTYQVLLKIRFKDNVPTETTYVLSRVLH